MKHGLKTWLARKLTVTAVLFSLTFYLPSPIVNSAVQQIKKGNNIGLHSPKLVNSNSKSESNKQNSYLESTVTNSRPTKFATTYSPTPSPATTKANKLTAASKPRLANLKSPARKTKKSNLDHLFDKYASEFNVSKQILKHIAYCESRFNPYALNGSFGGLFQFHPNTWVKERQRHGWDPNPELRFNSEEAIKTAAAKIAGGGIGAWPNCR